MNLNFGQINDMTQADFEKAMNYYSSKIEKMKEDDTIDNNTKLWFISQYNERLNTLSKAYKRLKNSIAAEKRTSSDLLNEKTATLDSLSNGYSNNTDAFENVSQISNNKHGWKQFGRVVLGILFLPTVFGSVPFWAKIVKEKRLRKNVENIIDEQNNDITDFLHNETNSFDAKVINKQAFTEEEMLTLAENPSEINRLTVLLNPSDNTLDASQKKNLKKNLIALRDYAQKNDINLSDIDIKLPSNDYATEKDKSDKKYNDLKTSITGITTNTVTNLKTASDSYDKLNEYSKQVNEILYDDPDNTQYKQLQKDIGDKITELKTNTQAFISAGATAFNNDLNGLKPTGTTKTDYETSNTSLDNAHNAANTRFGTGVSITAAETYARNMGLDTTPIASVTTTHSSLKNDNNAKLEPIKQKEKDDKLVTDTLNNLKNIFDPASPATGLDANIGNLSSANVANIPLYKNELSRASSLLESIKSLINTPAYASNLAEYLGYQTRFSTASKELITKEARLTLDVTAIENAINSANGISNPYTPTGSNATAKLINLKTALSTIENTITYLQNPDNKDLYDKLYPNISLGDKLYELTTKKSHLEQLIEQETLNESTEKSNSEFTSYLQPYETIVNGIDVSTLSGSDTLNNAKTNLNSVINSITDDLINNLSNENKSKATQIKSNAMAKVSEIKSKLIDIEKTTFETDFDLKYDEYTTLLSSFQDYRNDLSLSADINKYNELLNYFRYANAKATELSSDKSIKAQIAINSLESLADNAHFTK